MAVVTASNMPNKSPNTGTLHAAKIPSQLWQPRGYQKLANLMGPRPEAGIFRRFGSLTAINLLSLQAELIDLEVQLRDTWKEDDESPDSDVQLYSVDFWTLHRSQSPNNLQLELLLRSREKLQQYHTLLLQAASVTQLGKPREYDVRFLQQWLRGSQEGAAFLRGRELKRTWDDANMKDFVSLVNNDADSPFGWLNPKLVDWYNNLWGGRKEHRKLIDSEIGRVVDYSDYSWRVKTLRFLFLFSATIIMSLVPALAILWLDHVQRTNTRIWITVGLTAVLGVLLRATTNANMKEIFGATAAFAAVEVVFIGSANGKS